MLINPVVFPRCNLPILEDLLGFVIRHRLIRQIGAQCAVFCAGHEISSVFVPNVKVNRLGLASLVPPCG
jgi:hypothetical protein